MEHRAVRVTAVIVALCYAALAIALLGLGEAMLAMWVSSPLLVSLAAALLARARRTQRVATGILAGLAVLGAGLLVWGLVLHPGDYNHLVAISLPLYQFAFLALAWVAFGLASLVRRLRS